MDPLSDVLSLLKPRSLMSAGFETAQPWSITFPGETGTIKCGAVVAGSCWLAVDGHAPVQLQTGDGFLLPGGRPFRMASDLALTPVVASEIFSPARRGGIVVYGDPGPAGAAPFSLVSSRFALTGEQATLLLGLLPAIVHLRNERERHALRWLVEHMMEELGAERAGGGLVLSHLAQMMLIQALRLHLEEAYREEAQEGEAAQVGWLFALADRRMSAAIGAIHADPARRWTLPDLAERARMSRSSFALRFKRTVGSSPMDYLTRWRMTLAAERLGRTREPVAAIAASLGYDSDSAFSTAFKRATGRSPPSVLPRATLK